MNSRFIKIAWLATTLAICVYLAFAIKTGNRSVYLPGPTTDGHYQIELECASCHTPFGGVRQQACLDCHAAELEAAQDSHAAKKFTDPRNADLLARVDALRCVTCHVEHRPEITGSMGVTIHADHCRHCHSDIAADERPTHTYMSWNSCASAGCHNFHDNRALYEDFLVRHGSAETPTFASAFPARETWISWESTEQASRTETASTELHATYPEETAAWTASAHASGQVGCAECHQVDGQPWASYPAQDVCHRCHALEAKGFGGRSPRNAAGARTGGDVSSRRTTADAARVAVQELGLQYLPRSRTRVDVRSAAVEACLFCHADEHSKAYEQSPHFRLWRLEVSGHGRPGSGVSCASCHLPREARNVSGEERIVVQHNQNANLRPNEKMIREVCLTCHSLALSIDALADPDLIRRNFAGEPSRHVPSINMALSRTVSSGDQGKWGTKESK